MSSKPHRFDKQAARAALASRRRNRAARPPPIPSIPSSSTAPAPAPAASAPARRKITSSKTTNGAQLAGDDTEDLSKKSSPSRSSPNEKGETTEFAVNPKAKPGLRVATSEPTENGENEMKSPSSAKNWDGLFAPVARELDAALADVRAAASTPNNAAFSPNSFADSDDGGAGPPSPLSPHAMSPPGGAVEMEGNQPMIETMPPAITPAKDQVRTALRNISSPSKEATDAVTPARRAKASAAFSAAALVASTRRPRAPETMDRNVDGMDLNVIEFTSANDGPEDTLSPIIGKNLNVTIATESEAHSKDKDVVSSSDYPSIKSPTMKKISGMFSSIPGNIASSVKSTPRVRIDQTPARTFGSMSRGNVTVGEDDDDIPPDSPMKTIKGILSTIPSNFASASKPPSRSRLSQYNTPNAALALRAKKSTTAVPKRDGTSGGTNVVNKTSIAKQVEARLGERSYQRENRPPTGDAKATPYRENVTQKAKTESQGDSNSYIKHSTRNVVPLEMETPQRENRMYTISDHQYHDNIDEVGGPDEKESEDLFPENVEEDEDDLLVDHETIDATCIPYGSHIMVQSHSPTLPFSIAVASESVGSAVKVEGIQPQRHRKRHHLANAIGIGAGGERECFYISNASLQHTPGIESADIIERGDGTTNSASILRYGDTISIHSSSANKYALGVRKLNPSDDGMENSVDKFELGFFRAILGKAEKWMVLRGGMDKFVSIGPSAAHIEPPGRKARSDANSNKRMRAVRFGEPLVLRNLHTGGLLTIEDGSYSSSSMSLDQISSPFRSLSLITTSYQTNGGTGSTENNQSLISYMQHHNKVKPRSYETFHFLHVNAPPCPNWSRSPMLGEPGRPFLNGTYLLHPDRHDMSDVVERALFLDGMQNSWQSNDRTRSATTKPLGTLSVSMQERILLDEIIGALMGLEGEFIRVQLNDFSDSENDVVSDSVSKGAPMDGMEAIKFGLASFSAIGGMIDPSLGHLVKRILPVCTDYVRVNHFVSAHLTRYEYGATTQALCEAMDVLLQEYLIFVTQMEHTFQRDSQSSIFSMSKLYVCVQPSIRTMAILNHVVQIAKNCKGGALLNAVRDLMTTKYLGDTKGQDIIRYLLDKASVPYMDMLNGWLNGGILHDPFGEFMIEQKDQGGQGGTCSGPASLVDESIDWNEWYGIRTENVLRDLLSPHSRGPETAGYGEPQFSRSEELVHKVLTAGKYWNAIRLCQMDTASGSIDISKSIGKWPNKDAKSKKTLKYSMGSIELASHINKLFRAVSNYLLHLMLHDHKLITSLRIMKRYFLLDQGDFFVHFLDMAEDELLQELSDVARGRVQSWLSMSIHLSSGNSDFSDQEDDEYAMFSYGIPPISLSSGPVALSSLRCDFATQSLSDHLDDLYSMRGGIDSHEPRTPSRNVYGVSDGRLTGVEAFMLDFHHIPFPTSLVLSPRTITNYQLLFRHLFFAKHVERRLVGTWLDHQMIKELQPLRKALGPTYSLRHRMLHFMQNLVYYMMFEVIEPNWQKMEHAILFSYQGETTHSEGSKYHSHPQEKHTVDDVLAVHSEFLKQTLKECLLTNRDHIRVLTKLMTTCLLFSDQMKRFIEATQIDDERNKVAMEERQKRQRKVVEIDFKRSNKEKRKMREMLASAQAARRARIKEQTERISRELNSESYKRMIRRFNEVFRSNLNEFMSQLMSDSDGRHHTHLSNLCTRLDYNEYVTRSMGL